MADYQQAMDGTQKKISFGFSKLKQGRLTNPVPIKKDEKQYVDSFDGEKGKFSFQGNLRIDEEVKKPLVIPLIGTRSAYDVIKNKLDTRDGKVNESGDKSPDKNVESSVKEEDSTTSQIDDKPQNGEVQIKQETPDEDTKKTISLDALAAKELLEGNIKKNDDDSGTGPVIVPEDKPVFEGEKESTLEDYENVPVGDYGLALLRGMGWSAKTGIGKENKVVAPVAAKVRPKRLGLGAEVALIPPGERPPLKKGSLVKVAVGQYKNDIGVVEGIDGDTGSVFVKLRISGSLSLSENVIITVTQKEYEDILNSGGPKMEVSLKPATEKKYGIVFKNDEPKVSHAEEDIKPSLILPSKVKSEREKSKSPRRIKSESRKRDYSSDDSRNKEKSRGDRRKYSSNSRNNQYRSKEDIESSEEERKRKLRNKIRRVAIDEDIRIRRIKRQQKQDARDDEYVRRKQKERNDKIRQRNDYRRQRSIEDDRNRTYGSMDRKRTYGSMDRKKTYGSMDRKNYNVDRNHHNKKNDEDRRRKHRSRDRKESTSDDSDRNYHNKKNDTRSQKRNSIDEDRRRKQRSRDKKDSTSDDSDRNYQRKKQTRDSSEEKIRRKGRSRDRRSSSNEDRKIKRSNSWDGKKIKSRHSSSSSEYERSRKKDVLKIKMESMKCKKRMSSDSD